MTIVSLTRKITILLLGTLLAIGCSKKYAFDYKDGTPGDGATGANITVDTSVKKIDISKYAQARVFPGLVCSTEPRLNNLSLAMDLNYNFVGNNLRISVPPQPLFSTGLYAPPGELAIIDVPASLYSLAVQVGAWTDNLSSVQNAPRDPLIYSRMQLAPGRNYIRNLYGGHIYIDANVPIAAPVNLVFSNVVKSPDFISGVTSNAEWQAAIRASCVPWLELRSANMIFTVPRDYCITRPISDIVVAMQAWNDIINLDYYQWEGLEANPANPVDKSPLLPWRVVMDIKPVVGYGHNGFPIVVQNDYSWFSGIGNVTILDGGGNWGFLHELGHNNQQNTYWSWSTLGETTCNLFSFKVAKRLSAVTPTAWPPRHPALATAIPNALSFALDASTTKNFDGTTDARINDAFSRLTPFIQLFDKVPAGSSYNGWDLMGALYKKARRANRISLNDQDKRDFFYETVCDFTHKDWVFFFKAWGINISNISKAKMSALYPVMNQEIWKYNPLTRTGGNTTFNPDPYATSNWVLTFSSQEPTGEGPPNGLASAILDGNANTFWHSNWSGPAASPPHVLTIDMGTPLSVTGFVFTQRQSLTRNIKNMRVETSTNGTSWTAVTGSPFLLTQTLPAQTKTLPAAITCRYFRLTVASAADVYDGSQFAALAEVNVTH
jgi:hypothetical protein